VERGLTTYQQAIDSLVQATVLDPRVGPAWLMAGSVALEAGRFAAAELFFDRARRVETMPPTPFHFFGALTMLGFVYSRQFDWERALKHHTQSLESLRDTQHVYRNVFVTLSACGLGEIELRSGRPEEALTRFRHGWRIVKEEPRMGGNTRLGI